MKFPTLHPRRVVPLIVACAVFMENLDSTIIATALPQIARALHEDPLHLSLAITAYLLSLAVFIPLSGWVADRHGARRVFRAAILVFTFGSVLCGLSQSMPQLIGARILQGLGGALMVPVGRLVLLRAIPKSELIAAMSWLTVPALFGPILGPPLGGLIVTYASWRWIFFINVPIGLLGWWLVTRFIDDTRAETRAPLDFGGWLLVGSGLVLLVMAFELLGKNLLANAVVYAMIVAGIALLLLYAHQSRQREAPIVDLRLLRIASFRISISGGSLYRCCVGAYTLLMPLMLQLGFGYSAAASGGITFVSAAGAMLMKATAPRIVRRFGFRPLLLGNSLLSAVFLLGCAQFAAGTPKLVMLGWLLVYGFFRSLQFTCINTLGYADVPPSRMSQATSFSSTAQQLSLSVGVGIGSQVLNTARALHGGGALVASDFQHAFMVIAALTAASALLFRRLSANAGSSVSGHPDSVATPD
ncbi:MDR family MFS transporter [Solimonas terrae]|uniref:Multidrug efflux MFS transporter n=1 Tax=Solimonas terrae TaxID=1396819 RepID=A0A6M2BWJ5_9GAMM|nr:MDR family MFS transporter [Solimonas terrae]NGY06561.1 multidrug efflux MFS transporter [Solimonas terrae]